MTPNWMGLVTAAATFFGIWMGHVGVRKIEAASPSLWIPALGARGLGAALEIGALLSTSLYLSGALGTVGMTFLWDALEFRRQHMRVRSGHAPRPTRATPATLACWRGAPRPPDATGSGAIPSAGR